MAKKSNISYSEAMAEIEAILTSLQRSDCDVEQLAKQVGATATEAPANAAADTADTADSN